MAQWNTTLEGKEGESSNLSSVLSCIFWSYCAFYWDKSTYVFFRNCSQWAPIWWQTDEGVGGGGGYTRLIDETLWVSAARCLQAFVSLCQENSFRSISLGQPCKARLSRSAKNEGPKRRSQEGRLLGIFLMTGNDRGLGVQHCHTTTSKQKNPTQKPHAGCVSGYLCRSWLWLCTWREESRGHPLPGRVYTMAEGMRAHRRLL